MLKFDKHEISEDEKVSNVNIDKCLNDIRLQIARHEKQINRRLLKLEECFYKKDSFVNMK